MLTSYIQIRDEGNLPETIKDEKLKPHWVKAVVEMKRILTEAVYEEILAKEPNDADYDVCAIAEANLTVSYAITSLNIETHGTGIVRSKGFDESRADLLSQGEVDKLRTYYKNIAMDLLKPYIPQMESTEDVPADEVRGANYRLSAV